MVDWNEVRAEFPVLSECTYLDTAAVSPSPTFLSESYGAVHREKIQGTLSESRADVVDECKGRLADLLAVDEEELLFVSNTTEGINVLAQAVEWEAGDEVIISDLNFASNAFPWVALRDRGVRVRVARSDAGRLPPAAVTDLLTEDTRLVSLPHVSMSTGYRLDLSDLSATLAGEGVHLTLDGVQGLGCVRPDLTHVSGYAASLYKWLLGPFGMGLLYVDREFAEDLTPRYVGYHSVRAEPEPDRTDAGTDAARPFGEFRLKDGPGKLQYGHVNFPAVYCLNDTLAFMEEVGWDRITDRVLSLSGYLHDRLSERDDIEVVTDRTRRCGIVVFESTARESDALVSALGARDVHVSNRGQYVRAATHFYNSREDVDALLATLDDI